MKVVLDTNVLVAAVRSRQGASYQLIRNLPQLVSRCTFLLSVPLFLEYEAVLKRQSNQFLLDHQGIDDVLDYLVTLSTPTKLYYLWRPTLPDPSDDMVLELAVAGNADAIVTFNTKDFMPTSKLFGIKTVTPRQLWFQLKENIQ